MAEDSSPTEYEYSEVYEDWDIDRFCADMAKEGLRPFSPNAMKFFRGVLRGHRPIKIAKDCGYFRKDGSPNSDTVRKTISKEIRPAVELLRDDKYKNDKYHNFADISKFLRPKYLVNRNNDTKTSIEIIDSQTTHETKNDIDIQFTDCDTLLFGSMKTTWLVKDGTGEREYYRDNIVSHYQNIELELPPEIQQIKEQIAREEKAKKLRGEASFWNGIRYSLDKFVITRTTHEENPILDFWFRPSDYYTYLATNQRLDRDTALREKYFQTDWQQPIGLFANTFSVYLSVITDDGYLIITQRGLNVGSRPGELNISANEGLSREKDHVEGKPDLYKLGSRAIYEELGIKKSYPYLKYLSFGVDIMLGHWAIIGTVKLPENREFVERRRRSGVEDKWENTGIYFIEFELETVIDYVLNSSPWSPGAIACIYHTLVHEFGRDKCDRELMKRSES